MAIEQLPWNDGSTDVLECNYSGTAGTSSISFSTPNHNEWTDREREVLVSTITGDPAAQKTIVVQQTGKREFLSVQGEEDNTLKYKCSDGKFYCVLKQNI